MVSVLYLSERPEITPHKAEPNKAKTTKGNIEPTKGENMNLKKVMQFNNPPGKIKNNMTTPHLKKSIGSSSSRLALFLIALVFACLGIRQSAHAGYTVTLQQVGPNVVATGTGAIDLHGLTFLLGQYGPIVPQMSSRFLFPPGRGSVAEIYTGPRPSSVDLYSGPIIGPTSFGGVSGTFANSGSGDMVGIGAITGGEYAGVYLYVPAGYVSGAFLSDSATYSGKTFANLGVRPGTYVWTWGTGANQNFTLQSLYRRRRQ